MCCVLVAQSCLPLCDPIDCSPPGSCVHEIFQARILEWVASSFSNLDLSLVTIFFLFSFLQTPVPQCFFTSWRKALSPDLNLQLTRVFLCSRLQRQALVRLIPHHLAKLLPPPVFIQQACCTTKKQGKKSTYQTQGKGIERENKLMALFQELFLQDLKKPLSHLRGTGYRKMLSFAEERRTVNPKRLNV